MREEGGDVGASPITGAAIHLTQAQVNGTIYEVDATGPPGAVIDPTLLTAAKGDLTTAINDAAGRSPGTGAFAVGDSDGVHSGQALIVAPGGATSFATPYVSAAAPMFTRRIFAPSPIPGTNPTICTATMWRWRCRRRASPAAFPCSGSAVACRR